MNVLKNITFDSECKKNTAVIFILLGVLIILAAADSGFGSGYSALRFLVILAGDLCACAVLTLYFHMARHALCKALSPESSDSARFKIFLITDVAALIMKTFFIIFPVMIRRSSIYLPQFTAFILDVIFSGIFISRLTKKAGH